MRPRPASAPKSLASPRVYTIAQELHRLPKCTRRLLKCTHHECACAVDVYTLGSLAQGAATLLRSARDRRVEHSVTVRAMR
ncbi:MAG: hypothetical protein IPK82_13515 [Polyangiaceae bacterium]|nr:hypothetical protein [Polyangiaceae bacterium]